MALGLHAQSKVIFFDEAVGRMYFDCENLSEIEIMSKIDDFVR